MLANGRSNESGVELEIPMWLIYLLSFLESGNASRPDKAQSRLRTPKAFETGGGCLRDHKLEDQSC